jgi:ABC-type branched-subunit amino acid transport system ATPase component
VTEYRHDLHPLLEGYSICKSFGGITALSQVDIAVHPGEVLGIIGPNGSGKTTLINCLSRVLDITHGRILLKGEEITRKKPYQVARMGMARTFQEVRVYRKLSVLENMLLSRQWRGEGLLNQFRQSHPRTEARAREIIDFLSLNYLMQELAGNLSLGQQRILEIGMALMSDPDLFILDEATSGINPTFLETIKERIRHLNIDKRKTFILIEHNMNFIEDMCNRVFVLDHGEKLAEGTPGEVINNQQVIEAYLGTHLEDDEGQNDW